MVTRVHDRRRGFSKRLAVSMRIRDRKEELKCRRGLLSSAMVMLNQDVATEAILEQELSRERCVGLFCVDNYAVL
jgi:hypothetical protein